MRQLAEHEGHIQYFELTSDALKQGCFGQPRRIELIVADTRIEPHWSSSGDLPFTHTFRLARSISSILRTFQPKAVRIQVSR